MFEYNQNVSYLQNAANRQYWPQYQQQYQNNYNYQHNNNSYNFNFQQQQQQHQNKYYNNENQNQQYYNNNYSVYQYPPKTPPSLSKQYQKNLNHSQIQQPKQENYLVKKAEFLNYDSPKGCHSPQQQQQQQQQQHYNYHNDVKQNLFKEPVSPYVNQMQYPISKQVKRTSDGYLQYEDANSKRLRLLNHDNYLNSTSTSDSNSRKMYRSLSMIEEPLNNNNQNSNELNRKNYHNICNNTVNNYNLTNKLYINDGTENNKKNYQESIENIDCVLSTAKNTNQNNIYNSYKNQIEDYQQSNLNMIENQNYQTRNTKSNDNLKINQQPLIYNNQQTNYNLYQNNSNKYTEILVKHPLTNPVSQLNGVKMNENLSKSNSKNIPDDVIKVMNSLLSIFDSIDLIDNNNKNNDYKTSNNGIFPYHVISSIFKLTVGERA